MSKRNHAEPCASRAAPSASKPRRNRCLLRIGIQIGITILVSLVCGAGVSAQVAASELLVFEAISGSFPGAFLALAAPTSNRMIEIEYSPYRAEGGGFYGLSELRIVTTGDVVFEAAGFACDAQGCLYAPSPFQSGQSLTLTAAEDLAGEFGSASPLARVAISGTTGYVIVAGGDYLDATGTSGMPGAVRSIDPRIVVRVPEPSLAIGLALGVLGLGLAGASKRRR